MKSIVMIILVILFLLGAAFERGAQAAEDTSHEQEHESRFSLFSLVKPLGIATLCLVGTTFLTGLFRRKLGKKFLKVHVPLAVTSVILGLAHGTLVFILFG